MSRSVNKVFLLGRLGKDAETSFTPSGVCVSKFSIATEQQWKDKDSGEWKKETEWTNCVLWRQEKLSQYLTKGSQVHVEGRLQARNYEAKDGGKRYVTEVVVNELALLGSKGEGERSEPRSERRTETVAAPDTYEGDPGDVPF